MPDARLTDRELEVMRASVRHHGSSKLVALELGISHRTVEEHRRRAYAKLGASGGMDAAERLGWLKVPE